MRKSLDLLYITSGALAALCLALIALSIVAQIFGRIVGVTIDSTESGAFFLAGMTFLGMAYTLKTGGHIRVSLLVSKFDAKTAWIFDLLACGFAAFASAYLSWQVWGMVHDSWRFGDLSPGLLAVPMWIPQTVMLVGLCILTIAFFDELILLMRRQTPGYLAPHDSALGEIDHIE